MAFPITIVRTPEIVWDSLYVGKIVCYPFEEKDYKPYAQVSVCYHLPIKALAVRMWAFETDPVCTEDVTGEQLLKDSTLALKLYSDSQYKKEDMRFAAFNRAGRTYANFTPAHVKTFEGEDLQGVYWGVQFEIPVSQIGDKVASEIKSGDRMRGNFYKLCLGEKTHQGSYKQITDLSGHIFCTDEMEDLVFVDY